MAEKSREPKKPASKVSVTKKTVKDLKLKAGKADGVKGGVLVSGSSVIVRR